MTHYSSFRSRNFLPPQLAHEARDEIECRVFSGHDRSPITPVRELGVKVWLRMAATSTSTWVSVRGGKGNGGESVAGRVPAVNGVFS